MCSFMFSYNKEAKFVATHNARRKRKHTHTHNYNTVTVSAPVSCDNSVYVAIYTIELMTISNSNFVTVLLSTDRTFKLL